LSGPAGTGKSRACLEKLHLCASLARYAGMRGLMVRKTMVSLTATGLVTYKSKVLSPLDGVTFFGGSKDEPPAYRYPNGSRLLLGGLDDSRKIMSSEYDMIYVQEATELGLGDWEDLTSRLRNGVMPYQQLIADCNPAFPWHWLKQRCDRGATVELLSRHEDNPRMHDGRDWTPEGLRYLAVLGNLTGARRERLLYGRWAAAEGLVYDAFDRAVHVIDRQALPEMRRYVAGVDWGYTNPGVIGVWGIDADERMYLVREVYRTHQLIDWWVAQAQALTMEYPIETFLCDPAEPAYITDFLRGGLPAQAGYNDIARGIQAVQARIAVAGDGKPRLSYVADALVARDDALVAASKPTSTLNEMEGYVWPTGQDGKAIKEVPVDVDNHGNDQTRYAVTYVDQINQPRPSILW